MARQDGRHSATTGAVCGSNGRPRLGTGAGIRHLFNNQLPFQIVFSLSLAHFEEKSRSINRTCMIVVVVDGAAETGGSGSSSICSGSSSETLVVTAAGAGAAVTTGPVGTSSTDVLTSGSSVAIRGDALAGTEGELNRDRVKERRKRKKTKNQTTKQLGKE